MTPTESREPQRVRNMFDGIAGRYDLLNRLLSGSLDRVWRRAAAREVAGTSGPLLDLCGGTGDLTLAVADAAPADPVICCDFSHRMLTVAAPKFRRREAGRRCVPLEADGLRLPFADRAFPAVTVAFGVRNFADIDAGFREIHRVLRPGGRLVSLEFSRPDAPVIAPLYRFYLRSLLPRLGDGVSGRRGPYGYLARTISVFPDAPELAGQLRNAGFAACTWRKLHGGIVAIHTATRGSGVGGVE